MSFLFAHAPGRVELLGNGLSSSTAIELATGTQGDRGRAGGVFTARYREITGNVCETFLCEIAEGAH
jgi:hypothetical protein